MCLKTVKTVKNHLIFGNEEFKILENVNPKTYTVLTRIVDAATILGFDLLGAATIQTESTIQWVYYYFDFYIESKKMYFFCEKNIYFSDPI